MFSGFQASFVFPSGTYDSERNVEDLWFFRGAVLPKRKKSAIFLSGVQMGRKFTVLFLLIIAMLSPLSAAEGESFALVLSGGAAKGYAHIAVLQELDRRGIVPDIVIGTSMGALIGGLYSAGYSGDEIYEICLETDINAMLSNPYSMGLDAVIESPFITHDTNLLQVSLGSAGVVGSGGLIDDKDLNSTLRRLVINEADTEDFDDLPIPFLAVTTDITTGDRIILDSGPLYKAMRASMSIPIVFAPVPLEDGGWGIDGGFVSNIPSDVAKDLGYDVILSVDVNDFGGVFGGPEWDLSTLGGSIDALFTYLSSRNYQELYDYSDYLIIVDTISTTDFNAVEEMVRAGNEAVAANQAVFDELEARVGGGKSRPEHIEKPVRIEAMEFSGLNPSERKSLQGYIGKEFSQDTIYSLEQDLGYLRQHARVKDIDYDMRDGVLYITAEEYSGSYANVGVGLHGQVGGRYDGDDGYFTVMPDFSAVISGFQKRGLKLDLGLNFDQGLKLDGGISCPLFSASYAYAQLYLQYGQLSWATVPGTSWHEFGNDISVGFLAGFGQDLRNRFRWDAVLGLDFVRIDSVVDTDSSVNLYAYYGSSLVYKGYEGGSFEDEGMNADVGFTFGYDLLDSELGYSFDASLMGVYGNSRLKLLFEIDAWSVRRTLDLAASYRTTKIGRMAVDDVSALVAVAFPLPKNMYVAAGAFLELSDSEGYERRHSSWKGDDYIPFSELDLGKIDFGVYVSGGVRTSFGRVYAELYVSAYPGVSFLIGMD